MSAPMPTAPRPAGRNDAGRLRGVVSRVANLRSTDRDQMWAVFSRYYADVSREKFEADLAAKQDVILLVDAGDHRIQGFSTLEVYTRRLHGRPFVAVYSGDTVVDEAYWGQNALQRTFSRYILQTKLRHPFVPVYWYLISKGYKTYLLLARNFPTHYPRHDRSTPAFSQAVLDLLSEDKFGAAFDKSKGILHFDECQGRLKRGIAPIDTSLLAYPDVRFFVEKNPGHVDGDELCCLGRIDAALPVNFLAKQVERSVARGFRRARERLWAGSS